MSTATANRLNFLVLKNDDRINAAIPKAMREKIKEVSKKLRVNESVYIKVALQNQLEKDLAETI